MTKMLHPAFFCDASIPFQVESKHKADLGHLQGSGLKPQWRTAPSGRKKNYDVIRWDKHYDEVKESVNQDVVGGCGHLSFWMGGGARRGNRLSKYFSRESPLLQKKEEAKETKSSRSAPYLMFTWGPLAFTYSCACSFKSSCVRRSGAAAACCRFLLTSMWSQAAGTEDDLI